jgi:deoxyribodipyrimidine photolyase
MSDTPETDNLARGNHVVPTEWAEQLERERDKAIRQLNNIKATEIHTCHDQCKRPMCILRRERDDARHEIEGWRNKWECAVEMAARAEIERDEARARK